LDALRPAAMERSFTTVSAFAQLDNLSKMKNASTPQSVRMEPTGTDSKSNALEFHATQVLHSATAATAVKPHFSPAQLVLIGMVSDVSTSLTSAPLV
jgi:hypothetical protein